MVLSDIVWWFLWIYGLGGLQTSLFNATIWKTHTPRLSCTGHRSLAKSLEIAFSSQSGLNRKQSAMAAFTRTECSPFIARPKWLWRSLFTSFMESRSIFFPLSSTRWPLSFTALLCLGSSRHYTELSSLLKWNYLFFSSQKLHKMYDILPKEIYSVTVYQQSTFWSTILQHTSAVLHLC